MDQTRRQRFMREIMRIKSLYMYLPLNETEGTVARNYAPATKGTVNGTTVGATPGVPGTPGRAYSFDGVNDKVTFVGPTRTTGQPLSVFAITKPLNNVASGARVVIMGVRNGLGAGDIWMLQKTAANFYQFEIDIVGSGGGSSAAIGPVLNVPVFLFGVYDGSNISIYVNGVLSGTPLTGKPNVTIDQTNGAIGIQADADTNDYTGLIQHAGIVLAAPPAEKILQLARIGGFA